MQERRDAILQYIENHGEVSIGELAAAFADWSEMTIRRDLARLEESRAILLTRGGARPARPGFGLSEEIYSEREARNREAKLLIAEKAAALAEPGKGIFIDAGTTAMALARHLPDANGVIVTCAPNIALEIVTRKNLPSVVMLGGTLTRRTLAVTDPAADAQLEHLNIDTAFLGASGFDEKAGFSVGSQSDGLLKRAVIARARRVVVLLDSSKFGVLMPFSFARADEVQVIVTDGGMPPELRKKLEPVTTII